MLSDLLSSSVEWYKEIRVLTYYTNGFRVNIHTLSKNQLQLSITVYQCEANRARAVPTELRGFLAL